MPVTTSAAVPKKTANIHPAHARIINEFRRPRQPQTLSEYYRSWNERVKIMDSGDENTELATKPATKPTSDPKIDPKEIGFTLGPAFTEEQFRAYKAGKGPRIADMYNEYHANAKKEKDTEEDTK